MTSLYQRLKESGNPKAAMEVICDLIEKGKTTREIANIMGITERWARTLVKRNKKGLEPEKLLKKRGPRNPHPKRTKPHIEALVLETQQKTNMGPRRLARELNRALNLSISPFTIRNILKRHNTKTKKFVQKTKISVTMPI
jgi:transposase